MAHKAKQESEENKKMSETMKAVAIMADHKAEVVEAVKPQAEPGKVLLKINACALCTFEHTIVYQGRHNPPTFG